MSSKRFAEELSSTRSAGSLTNRQIASKMFLAERTVKNYVSHLLLKLDMHGRTEAAVFSARLGTGA